jgi:hypothetical protein
VVTGWTRQLPEADRLTTGSCYLAQSRFLAQG